MGAPGDSQCMSLDLIARRGSSSLTWRCFGVEKTAICKLCVKSDAVKDSSTTNLFYHLQINHQTEYEEHEEHFISL